MNNLHYFSMHEVKTVSQMNYQGIVAYTAIERSMMNGTKSNYRCLFDLSSLAKTLEVSIEKLFAVAEFDVVAKNDLCFLQSTDSQKIYLIGKDGATSLVRMACANGLVGKSLGSEIIKKINTILEHENKER